MKKASVVWLCVFVFFFAVAFIGPVSPEESFHINLENAERVLELDDLKYWSVAEEEKQDDGSYKVWISKGITYSEDDKAIMELLNFLGIEAWEETYEP